MTSLPKPARGEAAAARRRRKRRADATFVHNARLARERDFGRCRRCGASWGIEVHHVVYRSRGGTHDLDNLLCLCRDCHLAAHGTQKPLDGRAKNA